MVLLRFPQPGVLTGEGATACNVACSPAGKCSGHGGCDQMGECVCPSPATHYKKARLKAGGNLRQTPFGSKILYM